MKIICSGHAKKRMKQRGIIRLEVKHILKHHKYLLKSFGRRKIAIGDLKGRTIKVVFVRKESYIKIITVK